MCSHYIRGQVSSRKDIREIKNHELELAAQRRFHWLFRSRSAYVNGRGKGEACRRSIPIHEWTLTSLPLPPGHPCLSYTIPGCANLQLFLYKYSREVDYFTPTWLRHNHSQRVIFRSTSYIYIPQSESSVETDITVYNH